jgi:hypothetical protein
MRSRYSLAAALVGLSLLCGYVGYALAIPQTFGPCSTDATHLCAFTCVQVVNSNPPQYTASVASTKVPYCAGTNQTACNPKAAQIQCSIRTYTKADCSDVGTLGTTYEWCCQ